MSTSGEIKVRHSVRYLQTEYEHNNKKPLEDLIRAWKGIKELPPTDKRSFFVLGGYHGEPFQYRRQVDDLSAVDSYAYWGGYCNHGNVLFPTWHRVYVHKLEQALQSIVPDVTMPFWDETSEETLHLGIPWVLTNEQFELDGKMIDNPLRSFVLPQVLADDTPSDDRLYEKPKGYETVRYPLSGLVGTLEARAETEKHNAQHPSPSENVELLNQNVMAWLQGAGAKMHGPHPDNPHPKGNGVYWQYENCLKAPNYTVFSNTTSASQWNLDHHDIDSDEPVVTPLEQPHNDVHLSVGGFDIMTPKGEQESGQIAGANGDMGENNTAAMDPIFFFHHCNVDRMFWLWQKQDECRLERLEIIEGYYGTSSSDSQGPTPGIAPGTPLNLQTPLNPFVKDEFGTIYTSEDCINPEKMGYTYGPGSFDGGPEIYEPTPGFSKRKLTVRGIDRALFQGSFVLKAFAAVESSGETTEYYLGHHSVLSRRNVVKCANCLTHLEVVAHFPLSSMPEELVDDAEYRIEIYHRGPELHPDLSYTIEVTE